MVPGRIRPRSRSIGAEDLDRYGDSLEYGSYNPHERRDGHIEITAHDLGDRYQFSIGDDGPGIPKGDSQSRIFEIFQTLNPETYSTENTGIGLAIVKKIVEGEGGKIWLDGEYNQGCQFCFTWMKTS